VRALALVALVGCGGMVEVSPPDATPPDSTAYYLDTTCAARPVGLSARTVEPGWHYDGSDPKVREWDTSRPSTARRVCWRAEGPDPCPCRDLAASETAYEVAK
jgi:hypothetical protein